MFEGLAKATSTLRPKGFRVWGLGFRGLGFRVVNTQTLNQPENRNSASTVPETKSKTNESRDYNW